MHGLSVCHCTECGTNFSMPTEAVEGVDEVTCPICGQDVIVQEVEAVSDDDDDDDEDEDEDDE